MTVKREDVNGQPQPLQDISVSMPLPLQPPFPLPNIISSKDYVHIPPNSSSLPLISLLDAICACGGLESAYKHALSISSSETDSSSQEISSSGILWKSVAKKVGWTQIECMKTFIDLCRKTEKQLLHLEYQKQKRKPSDSSSSSLSLKSASKVCDMSISEDILSHLSFLSSSLPPLIVARVISEAIKISQLSSHDILVKSIDCGLSAAKIHEREQMLKRELEALKFLKLQSEVESFEEIIKNLLDE
ncbi:hypothetical protein ADUPG1_009273 [Aduncisulcus paluster]|uniref:Uncharacterized protein n=2 Tax=Aduncisulcus paluster TaxID=2918883 RepID=A0ABQ5KUZ7_9EUKA|nr:hypothetical protein ADUPG1_009273 [Aduncisulcus paluster]